MIKLGKIRIYILIFILMITSCPISVVAVDTEGDQENTLLIMTSNSLQQETTTPGAIDIEWDEVQGNGFKIEFKVKDKWEGNYNAELIITNTQDTPLENWGLKFNLDAQINNIWGAKIEEHKNNVYKIKNLGWNQDIAVGESITIGISTTYSKYITEPYNYQWLGTQVEANNEDYTIEFRVTNDWGEGFNGEICITNNTDKVIEDWQLEFDFENNINQFWTAEILKHVGEHYVIKNAGYNSNIEPGQTLILGFSCSPGNVGIKPINFILSNIQDKEYITQKEIEYLNVNDYAIFSQSTTTSALQINSISSNISGNIGTNGSLNLKSNYFNVLGSVKSGIKTNDINIQDNQIKVIDSEKHMTIPHLGDYTPFSLFGEKNICMGDDIDNNNTIIDDDYICFGNLQYTSTLGIKFNASIMATQDIVIDTEEITGNNDKLIFIYSESGDINITAEKINFNAVIYAPNGSINITAKDTQIMGKILGNSVFISSDAFTLMNSEINTNELDVKNDTEELQVKYYNSDNNWHVTQNVILPKTGTNGSTITWISSHPEIIDESGKVSRPSDDASVNVKLIAKIEKGNVCNTKEFDVKVIKQQVYNNIHDNNFEDILTLNNGEMPSILIGDDTGIPRFICGKFTDLIVESPEEAISSLNSVKSIMNIENPENEFTWLQTNKVADKFYFSLQQVYEGIPVYGRQLIVSTHNNGETFALSGGYNPDVRLAQIQVHPQITKEDAEASAVDYYGTELEVRDINLEIYALNNISPRLSWVLSVYGESSEGKVISEIIFIDAINGKYIHSFSDVSNVDYSDDKYKYIGTETINKDQGGKTNIEAKIANGKKTKMSVYLKTYIENYIDMETYQKYSRPRVRFILNDTVRNIWIYDFNGLVGASQGPGKLIEYTVDGYTNTEFDSTQITVGGIDAMGNFATTYDFYQDKLGEEGLGGSNKKIVVSINYCDKAGIYYSNAAWFGTEKQFAFAGGDSTKYPFSTPLDIVAHEYTHGMIALKDKVKYVNNISAAINEGYSDIIGNLVEGDWSTNPDFGEDLYIQQGNVMRSLSNPNNSSNPTEIGGKYYLDPYDKNNSDSTVRHTNNSVITYAAWLMHMNGMDREKLAKLWYNSLQLYDNSIASYYDCREAVLCAAKTDNLCSATEIKIIKEAFNTVGISERLIDKSPYSWYYDDIIKMYERGYLELGKDGKIEPTKEMTLEQVLVYLVKAFTVKVPPYAMIGGYPASWQNNADSWRALRYAEDNGWIDISADPNSKVTREQLINFIWQIYLKACVQGVSDRTNIKILELIKDNTLKNKWNKGNALVDQGDIEKDFCDAVKILYVNGILFGNKDIASFVNQQPFLDPKKNVDWAYFAAIVNRSLK